MADLYTNAGYIEMLLIHGEARRTAREACRLYQQCYHNRCHPAHTMFARLERRLRETGSVRPDKYSCGLPLTRCTPEFEEAVFQHFEDQPSTIIRTVAYTIGVN